MGKFYEMINDFHDSSKKWDPITHYALDLTHKASTKGVGETSHLIGNVFGDTAVGNAGKHWDEMADKDKADFGRWGGNTLGSAAAIYGGMSAYGAAGAGGSGAGTGATTGGYGTGESLGVLASDGGGGAAAGGGAGGGSTWMKALSGGLRGGGNSMSQGAEQRQSSYDRRTAELLAQILREKQHEENPGWVNPNQVAMA